MFKFLLAKKCYEGPLTQVFWGFAKQHAKKLEQSSLVNPFQASVAIVCPLKMSGN